MDRIGREIASRQHWSGIASSYAAALVSPYHEHRLGVVKALLPDLKEKSVIDFGCGEGILMEYARQVGVREIIGIDIEPALLRVARDRAVGRCLDGGVERLAELTSADCIICANVLAYLTDAEELDFYRHAVRLLRGGGYLVVTHSNELFDLFTLNAYTVEFFRRHFNADPSALLTNPNAPEHETYNIRENPLAYPWKLRSLGFEAERMEYINMHRIPPLMGQPIERPDTLSVPDGERWKLMFQCSTFGVRAKSIRG